MTPDLNELRRRQEERATWRDDPIARAGAEADLRSLIDYTERLERKIDLMYDALGPAKGDVMEIIEEELAREHPHSR